MSGSLHFRWESSLPGNVGGYWCSKVLQEHTRDVSVGKAATHSSLITQGSQLSPQMFAFTLTDLKALVKHSEAFKVHREWEFSEMIITESFGIF